MSMNLFILGFLTRGWVTAKFDLVSTIYFTLARVYDLMLKINEDAGAFDLYKSANFLSLTQTIYTIAGIFMLFKVTLSMINMIINPDEITSGNASAGKLITRIVTSLIMLIMLTPKGWIFNPNEGIVYKLENGILQSMGNMMYSLSGDDSKKSDVRSVVFKDQVEAASDTLTCYYYETLSVKAANSSTGGGKREESKVNKSLGGVYKVNFYSSNKSGSTATKCGDNTCYYKVDTKAGAGFGNLPFPITDMGRPSGGFIFSNSISNSKCPMLYKSGSGFTANPDTNDKLSTNARTLTGYKNKQALDDAILQMLKSKSSIIDTENEYILNLINMNISSGALSFSRSIAKSFQHCQGDITAAKETREKDVADCESLQNAMFVPSGADEELVNLIVDNKLKIDTISSIVVGLIVIVYVLFLCIDVIVRKFKLMLLEILAPIPIISYTDPKSEIFNEWSKMYLATFADLFIKLFAIKIGIVLLDFLTEQFSTSENGLLIKFFYIVAILLFIKAIPDMISKIFGLDVSGGSFKDIFGMSKKALGVGAAAAGAGVGAAIGTAVGAYTAPPGTRLLQAFKGGLRGAGGGWKKDPLAGARSISADNYAMANAIAANNGEKLKLTERMKVGAQTALGIRTVTEQKEAEKQVNQMSQDTIKAIQDAGDGIAKAIQSGSSTLGQIKNLEANGILDGQTTKNLTAAVDKVISDTHRENIYDKDGNVVGNRIKEQDFSVTLNKLIRENYGFDKDGNALSNEQTYAKAKEKLADLSYDKDTGQFSLVGKDGNTYMSGSDKFTIGTPYIKGVNTAEAYYDKVVDDAKSNSIIFEKLQSVGVNLDEAGDVRGAAGATKVIGTTYDADGRLKREMVDIEKEIRDNKPTDDFVKGQSGK